MARTDATVAAVQLMARLEDGGGSFAQLLPVALAKLPVAERPRLQALCFGLARFAPQLQALIGPLIDKPLRRKDADVNWLLQLGVFQLHHTRLSAHAAVDSVVRASVAMQKPWAKGLVNAVLRRYQREAASLWAGLDEPARLAHPGWWYVAFQADWPEHAERLMQANNQQAPMSLRVNLARTTRADYQAGLQAQGLPARAHRLAPAALVLDSPVGIERLPGFADALVSVQDPAAQLAIDCLRGLTPPGGRLLDACAAPGGKTAHALESGHWAEVSALDADGTRLTRLHQTLERLQLRATVIEADAAATSTWWDGQPFDTILLDAPCSGSGVMRRHPDIKLLRRASDIDSLMARQQRLLEALWPLLKPGGCLLYATCSVLKQENEAQVERFVARNRDAIPSALPDGPDGPGVTASPDRPVWGQQRAHATRQILTGEHDMDGFFLAAMRKRS